MSRSIKSLLTLLLVLLLLVAVWFIPVSSSDEGFNLASANRSVQVEPGK